MEGARSGAGAAPRTAVVCDTTPYLPSELVESEGIHQVSLYVTLEGETEAEAHIGAYGAFYERLARSGESVATSQPSVGDFIEVYEPLLAEGRDVVSIHLSANISGTCASARQAREHLIEKGRGGERVHVYDSRSACGGMGLVVIAASRAARAGADPDAVLARAADAREALKMWFAIDSLEYLRRGGRIGAAQAWIGSTLRIKPILTFEEEVTPVERVRTRRRSIERMVDYARERHADGADGWVVQYIQDRDAASTLVEHCRDIFGSDPVFFSEIGPVIGAHVGPGLLGVGAIPRDLLT